MKHSTFVSTAARLMQAREPFLVVSPPGAGKTEGLFTAAETFLGLRESGRLAAVKKNGSKQIFVTHPVIAEEVDFRGLPALAKDANGEARATFLPFGFLRDIISTTEPTVVVIDDVGQARLSVQAALMQLVQLREIDGTRISDSVTFALASNRREDKAAVQGMVSALLDRCICVLSLQVDAQELAQWLMANDYPAILAAFVRWRPDAIQFDAKSDFEKSPTPRSIAGLGRLLKLGLSEPEVLAGAAGPSFATEFIAYRKVEESLPTLEEVFAKPEKVKLPKTDQRDLLYALSAGVASRMDAKNAEAGVLFVRRLPGEFQVMVMKDVVRKLEKGCREIPAIGAWLRDNAKLIGVEG